MRTHPFAAIKIFKRVTYSSFCKSNVTKKKRTVATNFYPITKDVSVSVWYVSVSVFSTLHRSITVNLFLVGFEFFVFFFFFFFFFYKNDNTIKNNQQTKHIAPDNKKHTTQKRQQNRSKSWKNWRKKKQPKENFWETKKKKIPAYIKKIHKSFIFFFCSFPLFWVFSSLSIINSKSLFSCFEFWHFYVFFFVVDSILECFNRHIEIFIFLKKIRRDEIAF